VQIPQARSSYYYDPIFAENCHYYFNLLRPLVSQLLLPGYFNTNTIDIRLSLDLSQRHYLKLLDVRDPLLNSVKLYKIASYIDELHKFAIGSVIKSNAGSVGSVVGTDSI
jgi:hypothetical protein